jgi:phosphohistidine phosphatase
MKTLLLMRHAKSSWKDTDLSDQERPLTKRGIKTSKNMGEFITGKELVPQKIYTSSAVRALDTARFVSQACHCEDIIVAVDEFYMAEPDIYYNFLKTLPDDQERVMLVGHNPGLESLLQLLSGRIDVLPTAVVAFISLPVSSWKDLNGETPGELIEIWRPKELFDSHDEKKKDKKKKSAKK